MSRSPLPGAVANRGAAVLARYSLVGKARRAVGGAPTPYLFITPFFLVFFAFFAYPVGYSFFVSLHHWAGYGPMRPVGLDNYRFVLSDNFWWGAVEVTGI